MKEKGADVQTIHQWSFVTYFRSIIYNWGVQGIAFYIFDQKLRWWVLVLTASLTAYQNLKSNKNFPLKFSNFNAEKFSVYCMDKFSLWLCLFRRFQDCAAMIYLYVFCIFSEPLCCNLDGYSFGKEPPNQQQTQR